GWLDYATTAEAVTSQLSGGRQLAWARAFIGAARSPEQLDVLRGWLDGVGVPAGLTVGTELRWSILQALVALGAAGLAEIDAELARDQTAAGQRGAATARALIPDAAAKADVWQELVAEQAPPNWRHRALLLGFWHPAQVELTRPWVERFHAVAGDIWRRRH